VGLAFTDLGLPNSSLGLALSQEVADKKIQSNLEAEWAYQTESVGVKLGGTFNVERENPPAFNGAIVFQRPNNLYWTVSGEAEDADKTIGASLAYITEKSEALLSVYVEDE
jgi:hypothetical protein